mmetsp:Transcript_72750/g.140607  ORF Transcript_72750/g.140607 Transcript_72750/m.140607 type:complete len:275 (+) Transcript_72750:3-827(+)
MMMTTPAGFSGIIRPGLAAGTLAATGTVTAGALTAGALTTGTMTGALPAPVPLPAAGGQTPETVPVGVMASMLKQVSKRNKDLHTAFVPYKPLEPLYTPQMLPPVGPPAARLLERLAEYYDFLGTGASKDENHSLTTSPALPAPEATTGTQPAVTEAGSPTTVDATTATTLQATTTSQTGSDGDDSIGAAAEKKDAERKEKRRIMCASGSRSRSRSPRSPTDTLRAAAAAMAVNAAISTDAAPVSKDTERATTATPAAPTVLTTPPKTQIPQLD